jgi:hypothetical protein
MNELHRLRATDWTAKPEATICSQRIMPMLVLLGYGEHTRHRVLEQHTYTLRDSTHLGISLDVPRRGSSRENGIPAAEPPWNPGRLGLRELRTPA